MGDIRPTAKWANRILRPLTSIYHRLEKHQDNIAILATATAKTSKERADGRSSTTTTAPAAAAAKGGPEYHPDSNSEPDDPAWVPGRPVKRRIRHSYSSRGQRSRGGRRRSRLSIRSPEVQRTLPGAIEIATPLITGQKTMPGLLVEGAVVPRRRLFRDTADAGVRASFGGMATTTNSFNAVYNTPWKEALELCGDARLVDIVRILDSLFLKFLLNTRVRRQQQQRQQQQQGHGARPLFSMAVRRLPEFIAEEQFLQAQDVKNPDEDMCDAYFTELEAHYAPSGNGWAPLCEAVRAQGIYLVSGMLQLPCFTRLMTCRLLDLCLARQEYDAVESMLPAVLSTMDETYGCPTAFDSVLSSSSSSSSGGGGDDLVQFLNIYWLRAPSRRSFVFGELAKLLLRGVLPVEWMVTTRWKRMVDGAIQSLSTGENDSAAAARFLEAVILTASSVFPGFDEDIVARGGRRMVNFMHPGRRRSGQDQGQSTCPIPIQDALSNLALSLVTALCGMHLARSCTATAATAAAGAAEGEEEEQEVGMRVKTIMGSVALRVQREIEMHHLSGDPSETGLLSSPIYGLRRGSVLLGSYLLHCSDGHAPAPTNPTNPDKPNFDAFCQTLSSRPDTIKDLAVLTRQVFSCAQRVRRTDGDDRCLGTPVDVRAKVVRLAEMSDQQRLSLFLGRVAAETAMQFADATVDPEDHVWAVEVQERVLQQQQEVLFGSDADYESSGENSDGENDNCPGLYRWEDSIEEWVATTPVSKMRTTMMVVERPRSVGWTVPSSPSTSTGASSSSSSSPNSGSSSRASTPEDIASSVTSSVPSSVPVKRPYPGLSRPAKRLRIASAPTPGSAVVDDDWSRAVSESETTSSTGSEEADEDHNDWQDDRPAIRSQPELVDGWGLSETQEQAPGGSPAEATNTSPTKQEPTHAIVGGTSDNPPLPLAEDDDEIGLACGSSRTDGGKGMSIPRRSLWRRAIRPEVFATAADEDSDDELSFL